MSSYQKDDTEAAGDLVSRLSAQLNEQGNMQRMMADQTSAFLRCLIDRHDLQNCLAKDQELDGIPGSLLTQLRLGVLPSLDTLALLSPEDHALLIREMVWICGHGAICWYREQGMSCNGNQWILEDDLSTVGWSETYVRAALALLLSCDPPLDLLRLLMPTLPSEHEQIDRNKSVYLHLEDAILSRHLEDLRYAVINAST